MVGTKSFNVKKEKEKEEEEAEEEHKNQQQYLTVERELGVVREKNAAVLRSTWDHARG